MIHNARVVGYAHCWNSVVQDHDQAATMNLIQLLKIEARTRYFGKVSTAISMLILINDEEKAAPRIFMSLNPLVVFLNLREHILGPLALESVPTLRMLPPNDLLHPAASPKDISYFSFQRHSLGQTRWYPFTPRN